MPGDHSGDAAQEIGQPSAPGRVEPRQQFATVADQCVPHSGGDFVDYVDVVLLIGQEFCDGDSQPAVMLAVKLLPGGRVAAQALIDKLPVGPDCFCG